MAEQNIFPKTITENGIEYTFDPETGTYLPFYELSQETFDTGDWGMEREKYLKENNEPEYDYLWVTLKMIPYLQSINEQAYAMQFRLMDEFAKADGVTEDMKNTDPIKWAGLRNIYKMLAKEIVRKELIEV